MAESDISYERLVDLAEGRIASVDAAALRQQIANTPAAIELTQLDRLVQLMRSDKSEDAPSYVINRALRLMRQPAPAQQMSGLRRLLALVQFDSYTQPFAAGVRSGPDAVRQMLFVAEDTELDLRIVPESGQWRISGQVLGTDTEGSITLAGSEAHHEVALNELSEFQLPLVNKGAYSLILRTGVHEIVAEMEIGT
jgi:hypothetical protein